MIEHDRLARSEEYLGKDRDQLREIILDRDEAIAKHERSAAEAWRKFRELKAEMRVSVETTDSYGCTGCRSTQCICSQLEPTAEPPYRIKSFWSPDRQLISTVCVSTDDISIVDDNGDIWDAAGVEQNIAESPVVRQREKLASTGVCPNGLGVCDRACETNCKRAIEQAAEKASAPPDEFECYQAMCPASWDGSKAACPHASGDDVVHRRCALRSENGNGDASGA